MNINIVCIGKLKEKYWRDAADEYIKRLGGFVKINVVELKEAKLPKNAGAKDEQAVIDEEGKSIFAKISDNDYVVALAIEGHQLDSVELSEHIKAIYDLGQSTIDFVIGGSLGLSADVKKRADALLSFSKLTFPHQLARVMLLEQIYRAFKIANGETYHK